MLVLFIGSCIVCTHTEGWKRFDGKTLGTGVSSIQVTGDSTFEWKAGGASMTRVSTMVAADGHHIELDGPRLYGMLGFSTIPAPREGTFRVVKKKLEHKTHGELYTAIMLLSNDDKDLFLSDSGSLTLTRVGTTVDGRYVVYVSTDSSPYRPKPRHLVARGTFHVEKRD